MGVTTTYKCDSCGHEDIHSDGFSAIAVCYGPNPYEVSVNYTARPKQVWCRNCMIKFGIFNPIDGTHEERMKALNETRKQVTFEDLVRELIQEEISHG